MAPRGEAVHKSPADNLREPEGAKQTQRPVNKAPLNLMKLFQYEGELRFRDQT